MWHLGVVLLDVELHQGAEPSKRVERVEVETRMLQRAPEGFDHRFGKGNLDLREHARLDADERARTAPSPGGDGGSRDGDVLRQSSGAAADRLLPEAMVARAARPRRGREGVHHHEDSTGRDSTTSENLNDSRDAEVAVQRSVECPRTQLRRAWPPRRAGVPPFHGRTATAGGPKQARPRRTSSHELARILTI